MADLADDTLRLMDAVGFEQAHVWGVSMGGKIAQEMALRHPERVGRLILAATTAGDAHRVEGSAGSYARKDPTTEQEWLDDVVPRLFGRAYREKNAGSMKAFARSRARHPQDPAGMARQREAYHAFDSWDRLPSLRHRTLVLTGDEDAMTDPRNADILVERLPDAVKVVIPGAGHSLHIEKPDEVNAVVDRFLGA
jgi:pimeloyl-ACP methyl ester carboxylesterase